MKPFKLTSVKSPNGETKTFMIECDQEFYVETYLALSQLVHMMNVVAYASKSDALKDLE